MEITLDEIIKVIREKKLCLQEDLVRNFLMPSELTEEESSRIFTLSELKQLCLRWNCKVDMWQWNPVDEVRERLEKRGRFNNYNEDYCLNLIAATVNKHKSRLAYKNDDIQMVKEEDWRIRKRKSIYLLKQWSLNDCWRNDPKTTSNKFASLQSNCVKQPGHGISKEHGKTNSKILCKKTEKLNTCQKLNDSYRVNVDLKRLKRKVTNNACVFNFDKFKNNVPLTSTQFLNSDIINKVSSVVNPQEGLLHNTSDSRNRKDSIHYKQGENGGENHESVLSSSIAVEDIDNQKINFTLMAMFDESTDSEKFSLNLDTELADSMSWKSFANKM